MSRRAFTIVEMLVVLAISALMSTLAITYSSVGRNQVALSVEEAKIAQFVLQAKESSIATYTSGSASCGYGVLIDITHQEYSIFAYSPATAPPCPSVSTITSLNSADEKVSTPGTWQVPVSNGVQLESQNGHNTMAVLFYPPDPTVFLSGDGTNFQSTTLDIVLVTADGQNSSTISINSGGQVSF